MNAYILHWMKTYQLCGVSKMAIVKWLKYKYGPDPKLDPVSQDTDPKSESANNLADLDNWVKGKKDGNLCIKI
jgi:hypothetical protein